MGVEKIHHSTGPKGAGGYPTQGGGVQPPPPTHTPTRGGGPSKKGWSGGINCGSADEL